MSPRPSLRAIAARLFSRPGGAAGRRAVPGVEALEDRTLLSFAVQPLVPIGKAGYYLARGDVNRDGKADLVVPQYNSGAGHAVEVLLGNGDGTFRAALGSPITVG